MRNKILSLILCVAMVISMLPTAFAAVPASEVGYPSPEDNLNVGLRSYSALTALDHGYMRVFVRGSELHVEYLDEQFQLLARKAVAFELPVWGGFFAGENGYYVVTGQNNTAEDDAAEVIRVTKYDAQWNRVGAAEITGNTALFGGEVRYPFDYGCVEMCELDGTLYLVTGHEGYVDPLYNQGHQGFLLIAVDETTMTGKIVDADLWHSFAQYIRVQGDELYVLEQSEGSRCTYLSKYAPNGRTTASCSVLDYGGDRTSAWAIPCCASVDDLAVSSDAALSLGVSIDQTKYDERDSNTPSNIYLAVTPLNEITQSATTVKWLTEYTGRGTGFWGVKITKIHDDRFLVTWEECDAAKEATPEDGLSAATLHYLFVDGRGNVVSEEFSASAPISDCHPIVKDGKVIYYASNFNTISFYQIDAQTGAFEKTTQYALGDHITWEVNGNVMTITGSGTLPNNSRTSSRYPVASSGSFGYSTPSPWLGITEHVKKVVVNGGVKNIPDWLFQGFGNLEEIELENGVQTIGNNLSLYNEALRKITIPDSVTSIAENAFYTGYYWIGSGAPVYWITIRATENSYAIAYAKAHNISYEIIECLHVWGAPQITSAGAKLYTCTICGRTKTEILSLGTTFVDIIPGQYYYNAVVWAAGNDITKGVDATHFAPENICTRAQVVTFLWRAAGKPKPKAAECPFVDVEKGSYYETAVLWAAEAGITLGTDASHFSPELTVTRGQFVTFLYRYHKKPAYTASMGFADVTRGSFYYDAVLWAAANGITKGVNATQFKPEAPCTRGQVVTFLYRDLVK